MTRPLVSVLMPVRNGGSYLQEAVQSILDQTFGRLELLLIDDHSTDHAISRLDSADPRLRILNSPGKGVINAFNHGLPHAQGEFIARMDADDISLPARFETQVAYLNCNPDVDIAGACVEIISKQEVKGGYLHYQQWLNSVRQPEQIRKQIFIESPIPNPTAMFRKAALEKLDGYRDYDWPEDYDLFLRADQAGMSMGKPEPVLFQWRDHADRLTHRDERYSRRRFQQAKAHYLANGRLPDGPIVLWGAGPGGRLFHDLLAKEGREVSGFIDVHPRRIGGEKRGKPVWSASEPDSWPSAYILVAVGSRGAKEEIRTFLEETDHEEGQDFVFVA
jgi:glycosyltransferase involved in cell wall biosynthesis